MGSLDTAVCIVPFLIQIMYVFLLLYPGLMPGNHLLSELSVLQKTKHGQASGLFQSFKIRH